MKYLQLIGFQDLLMIAIMQILIKYFLFLPFQIDYTLSGFGTFLLIFGTLSIAAAGKIILALNNTEADRINEKLLIGKFISEKTAYILFISLTVLGVAIGFYLSNIIGHPGFSALAIIISGLLYIYATYLKKQLFIGNLTIAVLCAFVPILPALYDLLPAISIENRATQHTIFSILLDYAFLAFLLGWLREILRDQENINGDHKAGNNTFSVAFGKMRTNKILFFIGLLPSLAIIYYTYNYLFEKNAFVLYVLVLILGPLLLFLAKILSAENKKSYAFLHSILTICMWFSLISIGLYKYILL